MIPFAIVAKLVGLGTAAGTRAGLTLLAMALAARFGFVALPPGWAWLAHPATLGALAALSLLEAFAERDSDLDELIGWVHYGTRGTVGAIAAMLAGWAVGGEARHWVAGVIGALAAVAMQALRRRLLKILRRIETEAFHPRRWLARLEEGGVIGVCVAAVLAPFLVVLLLLLGAGVTLAAWAVARQLEQLGRRPCPECAQPIRREASRCPRCAVDVAVVRWMG